MTSDTFHYRLVLHFQSVPLFVRVPVYWIVYSKREKDCFRRVNSPLIATMGGCNMSKMCGCLGTYFLRIITVNFELRPLLSIFRPIFIYITIS